MEKRLKQLLSFCEELTGRTLSPKEAEDARAALLIQIQFLQHERLIHLIVTVLFALLTVITLLAELFITEPLLLALTALFLILLIPYIRHYYILENGVQKLYEYYDKVEASAKEAP